MRWFGPAPFSNACDDCPRGPTPTVPCAWCGEGFTDQDEGYTIPHCGGTASQVTVSQLPYHLACWQRQLLGSVAHQQRRCSCYGGEDEDAPELTRRQAAEAAAEHFYQRFRRRT